MQKLLRNGLVTLVCCCVLAASGLSVRAAQPQQPPNVIDNAGFEQGATAWELCSGAAVTDSVARSGQQSLRLGPPTGIGCEDEVVELGPVQVAYQEVAIPANAEAVTVSFWYTRGGNPNEGENELTVALVSEPDAIAKDVQLDSISGYDLAGWTLYRQTLRAEQLEMARGNTWLFAFQLEDGATGANDIAFFIDDVRVQIASVQTAVSPLPADLQSNSTQPIVVTQFDPENSTDEDTNFAVFRTNTDGTNRQRLYTGLLGAPNFPTWASDGSRIAVVDASVSDPTDASRSGLISILSIMNADGSDVREVYRTVGGGGDINPPFPPEIPNVDTRITSIDWSPDGSLLGATVCGRIRDSGGASDEICWLDLIDVATSDVTRRIRDVFSFDWGANNRILYSTPSFGDAPPGIYELDMRTQDAEPTLLARNWSSQIPFREERTPVWAPDGRHFVVVRDVAGLHFNAEGEFLTNTALVLYDRENIGAPRFLLLADHGSMSGTPTWSPDGKYLLYTLFESEAAPVSVWWLAVETGNTGPMLVNEASFSANWLTSGGPGGVPGGNRTFLPITQR